MSKIGSRISFNGGSSSEWVKINITVKKPTKRAYNEYKKHTGLTGNDLMVYMLNQQLKRIERIEVIKLRNKRVGGVPVGNGFKSGTPKN